MKALSALFLIVFSVGSYASTIPDFPFVTVTGQSSRQVEPDSALLTFNIVTYNEDAQKAKSLLNKTAFDIVKEIKLHGVIEKNITSFEVNKRAKRARGKSYNDLNILGYEFTQRFELKTDTIENYSELTNALLNMNQIENIETRFEYSKSAEVEVELIQEAAKKAKQKAEHMAAGLGVKIDSVFAFNDSGSFSSFFATFGLNTSSGRFEAMRSRVGNSSIFVPQFIELSKSINVVYKIQN